MKKMFITILMCMAATTMMAQTNPGYGTFYYSNYDVTIPSGVVAFVVTGPEPTYQKIADGNDAVYYTVPKGTAVLLYQGDADTGDVNRNFTTNLLHGSDTQTTTFGGGEGAKYYKLTFNNDNTIFGWYWGAEGGAAFTSPAHKAWLVLPATSGARTFVGLPGEDTTGITSVTHKQQGTENVWYDLNGRRINAPQTKGIYVKGGRKMVIK